MCTKCFLCTVPAKYLWVYKKEKKILGLKFNLIFHVMQGFYLFCEAATFWGGSGFGGLKPNRYGSWRPLLQTQTNF